MTLAPDERAGAIDGPTGFGGETDHRVTPLELLFDLVFAFAFTQVTTLWPDEPPWTGLARGLLVLTHALNGARQHRSCEPQLQGAVHVGG